MGASGSIPARAGRTLAYTLMCHAVTTGQSPRVRGGPKAGRLDPKSLQGSVNPRACGADLFGQGASGTGPNKAAHPRACGADIYPHDQIVVGCGLRPIPARAGRTLCGTFGQRQLTVTANPRACGADESLAMPTDQGAAEGQSPRVRGGLELAMRQSQRDTSEANPRACGADSKSMRQSNGGAGQSPRVRGGQNDHSAPRNCLRPIPARAGRTGRPEHPEITA